MKNTSLKTTEIIIVDGYEAILNEDVFWMINNLETQVYCNGDTIPNVQETDSWQNLKTGAWCYYNNDESFGKKYGKIYNGFAVIDGRGFCPCGWRVASLSDWEELSETYGGDAFSHHSLKSDTNWANTFNGNNSSNFNALPTGYRPTPQEGGENRNDFDGLSGGVWWTSSLESIFFSRIDVGLYAFDICPDGIYYSKNTWYVGQYVRCVKDIINGSEY